jgi:hypothetical protein
MTKYICAKCSEVFTHTARMVVADEKAGCVVLGASIPYPVNTIETAVCPFCHNIKFTEYIEPEVELEDVISVEYVNVGAKIAEGYKVKEIYAKSCTLVKPKKKVEA